MSEAVSLGMRLLRLCCDESVDCVVTAANSKTSKCVRVPPVYRLQCRTSKRARPLVLGGQSV
jgi:hypothetical protein